MNRRKEEPNWYPMIHMVVGNFEWFHCKGSWLCNEHNILLCFSSWRCHNRKVLSISTKHSLEQHTFVVLDRNRQHLRRMLKRDLKRVSINSWISVNWAYYSPTREESVEMDDALKAGQAAEPASEMQFWARATSTKSARALPTTNLRIFTLRSEIFLLKVATVFSPVSLLFFVFPSS